MLPGILDFKASGFRTKNILKVWEGFSRSRGEMLSRREIGFYL
jgi:hypothetical protein